MRVQLKNDDSGAIAIIVAILSVALVLMAAFAVDLGNAYAVKRQLSVAADSAALDAARAVAVAKSGGQPILGGGRGCAEWSGAQEAAAQTAAENAANATNAANDLSGDSNVDSVVVKCADDDSRVEVQVDNSRDLPVFFGGVADISGIEPKRSATAAVVPRLAIGDLRPFAVCNTVVDAAEAARTQTFVVELDKSLGLCGTAASGNWGLVDFNGTAGGANDTVDWTRDGYPDPVPAPDANLPVETGTPGPGALGGVLNPLVDQVILLPVVTKYTPTSGPGATARFDLVGFVSAKVCGYYLNASQYRYGSCHDASKAAPYLDARPQAKFIQFRYVDYTTGYSGGGPTCSSFKDDECKYAVLSAQLWK